jgi:MinD superfamily P-loop ATPase
MHIFLRPEIRETVTVTVPVPEVDGRRCTGCGECVAACEFHALIGTKAMPIVFPELCHGCGGCTLACPNEAIHEVARPIGTISRGSARGMHFATGAINVGEAMAAPLIRALRSSAVPGVLTIVDAPPGITCPTVSSIRGADFTVLVGESTQFGLHDLRLAVEAVRQLSLPFAVIINKTDGRRMPVHEFCAQEGIPVLLDIPDSREIAEAYCRGVPASEADPGLRPGFEGVLARIEEREASCANW